ncbi:hypothetical protein GGR53DRAFT_489955 [Hypoxylon sp. FL1150]|nr:hypothetical protein GGR53DRAFT_489955 [Hypoxylon sp. FL1150]
MSYTQDKAHSSAMLAAILDGEKAQQQQQAQQAQQASDSASIFSTSSFGSAKALLKQHVGGSSPSSKKSKSSKSSSSGTTEADLLRAAERNSVRMTF